MDESFCITFCSHCPTMYPLPFQSAMLHKLTIANKSVCSRCDCWKSGVAINKLQDYYALKKKPKWFLTFHSESAANTVLHNFAICYKKIKRDIIFQVRWHTRLGNNMISLLVSLVKKFYAACLLLLPLYYPYQNEFTRGAKTSTAKKNLQVIKQISSFYLHNLSILFDPLLIICTEIF